MLWLFCPTVSDPQHDIQGPQRLSIAWSAKVLEKQCMRKNIRVTLVEGNMALGLDHACRRFQLASIPVAENLPICTLQGQQVQLCQWQMASNVHEMKHAVAKPAHTKWPNTYYQHHVWNLNQSQPSIIVTCPFWASIVRARLSTEVTWIAEDVSSNTQLQHVATKKNMLPLRSTCHVTCFYRSSILSHVHIYIYI